MSAHRGPPQQQACIARPSHCRMSHAVSSAAAGTSTQRATHPCGACRTWSTAGPSCEALPHRIPLCMLCLALNPGRLCLTCTGGVCSPLSH